MSMIERVAKALEDATDKGFATWEEAARAAIEAMREPTPLMLARVSGLSPGGPSPSAHVLERWHSALDAALAP